MAGFRVSVDASDGHVARVESFDPGAHSCVAAVIEVGFFDVGEEADAGVTLSG